MEQTPTTFTQHSLDVYVEDLMQYKPKIFWADYLFVATLGWTAIWISAIVPIASWKWFIALAVSAMAFYRALIFIHEIIHFKYRKGILTGFPSFWNITCGAFFFFPYSMYNPHRDHHSTEAFGTGADPEYFPKIGVSHLETIKPLLMSLVLPFLLIARFLILGPISWITQGKLRDFILTSGSTLGINPDFKRNVQGDERKSIFFHELLVLAVWFSVGIGIYSGYIPLQILLSFYILYVSLLSLTYIQSLVAHRYVNKDGHPMSFDDQIKDSIVVEKPVLLTFIVTPLSLQYHSTHHLFPTMPYHSLREAHYRLKAQLPPDHPYHQTIISNIFSVLVRMWDGTLSRKK